MQQIPMTNIGGLDVSRIICGSNTFGGYSHFSAARDEWLKRYFTVDRIVEVMVKCIEYGVNSMISSPQANFAEALQKARELTGKDFHWICTINGDTMDDILDWARWCADHNVKICMPHGCYTDSRLNIRDTCIDEIEQPLAMIRELGMIPGLSTHRPEVLTVSQAAGYDVETCILPFNVIGFLCSVETDWMSKVICDYKKPVICIKPFAAGRVMPRPGFDFVIRNSKPIDTICAGFLSPEEADEDLKIAMELLEGDKADIKLTYSRSKKVFETASERQ